ncbi:MAG: hypothetical protein NW223_12840 [Hyphomicrobiaceae bacterium]|nr:hypothetical protein [Hyphomicrobiaceae bacterium]
MLSKLCMSLGLVSSLGLAALAGSASSARAADVDVYRVAPPPYYGPNRVVVVTPGPRCYWRVQRVWIAGNLVTRRVRRCV